MGFVLGFGITETRVEQAVKDAVLASLLSGGTVRDALTSWNTKADEYDKLPRETAPERYSRIFYYDDALHFHHVNRRHPFSPDGWACLMTEVPLTQSEDEEEENRRILFCPEPPLTPSEEEPEPSIWDAADYYYDLLCDEEMMRGTDQCQ